MPPYVRPGRIGAAIMNPPQHAESNPGTASPPPTGLRRGSYLDPRPRDVATAAPLDRAVNIPLAELADRTHELPPPGRWIGIVGQRPLAEQTSAALRALGRLGVWLGDGHPSPAPAALRLWEPTEYLASRIDLIPAGDALDLACGTGRDAVYLAARGWRVTAIDILPDAINRGRSLESTYALGAPPIRWMAADLESNPPIAGIGRRFDLITGFRYLHRPLFGRLHEWLNPGGHVIYETFTATHRDHFGKPRKDEHILHPGELKSLLGGFEIVDYSEDWHAKTHTARVHARLR